MTALHYIPHTWVRWEYTLSDPATRSPVTVSEPGGDDCVGPFETQEAIDLHIAHPSLYPTEIDAERAARCWEERFYREYQE